MNVASRSAPPEERREPGAPTGIGVVWALVGRDWAIQLSYRTVLVTDLTFGFLNLVMYHFISRALRPRVAGQLAGAPSYFAFAAVGISLTIVLQAAITGLARRVREEQLTGTLETLLAHPISSIELAFGLAGFPFVFAIIRALVYLLLAGLLLGFSFAHCDWFGLVASFLVAGLTFVAVGVGLAALTLVFKRAEAAGSFGTFAISLLGGAVFPTSVLPSWLKPLAAIVPTRFAFNAVRGAIFGARPWVGPTLVLLGIGVALMAAALALFAAAVRHVVRRGTVNQY